MAKLAFLLIAHRDPERLITQVRALIAHGDCVAIHWDARADKGAFQRIKADLGGEANVVFANRVRCGWGEFSLVRASLNLIQAARRAFEDITHYYLMSGDCYPTKPRPYFDRFLDDGRDRIEFNDFFESDWIRTGLKEDRLVFRHWFNERTQKRLFYGSLNLQRRFGLARSLPKGLTIRIGSQWWVLRASTIEKIMAFIAKRRDVVRFFRTTWIPDETFFQTLVAHLVPEAEIENHPPTHLRFSDYGMPIVFYGDHADYLRAQPRLCARKISGNASDLQAALLQTFSSSECDRDVGGANNQLYSFLADRGRKGLRFAPRFWERAINARKQSTLFVVCAKLWHIGEAIEAKAAELASIPSLGYIFDDNHDLELPLGGLESGLAKRGRHRIALMNMVYDAMQTEQLILCLDTGQADVLDELVRKIGDVRILLVDRPVSEAHIRGHARRAGLLDEESTEVEVKEVLKTLSFTFGHEVTHLRDHFADRLYTNALSRTREENLLDLGHFLKVPRPAAEALTREAERYKH